MSGSRTHPPRWPPQCSCVVIESSFDPGERLQAPGNLLFLFTCWKLMRHYVLPFSVFLPLSVHPLLVYFSLFWPNVLLSFCITLSNIHTRQWCIVSYVPQTKFGRHIVFAPFLIILIITSPQTQSGDVLLFYISFSLLLLLLLFFHTFLSARFLGDALIKLYETL